MKLFRQHSWRYGTLMALAGVVLARMAPGPGSLDSDLARGLGFLLAGVGLLWIAAGCRGEET